MTDKMMTAGQNERDPDNATKAPDESDVIGLDPWLSLANDAYHEANSWFDANIRRDMETNIAHFQNKHAPGSKYYKDSYKHRHKGFRPKTRAMVRKKEAAAAVALFSTSDVLHVKPERGKDVSHQVSAEINQEILQYRLDNTIPWFQTAMGAYQDTLVGTVCISHQYWDYEEVSKSEPEFDDDGMEVYDENGDQSMTSDTIVVKDTPAIDLRPVENVLFSPAADWRDPVNTSPYLIDRMPMFISDVKAMAKPSRTSKIPWFELDDKTLLKGATDETDAVRKAREGNREDSTDLTFTNLDYTVVWVHRNIMKKDGRDWIFYTLADHVRLSDPVPLEEEYPHLPAGERPYVLGVSNIETHKNYPDSLVKLGSGSQQEANEVNNQRRDNVALVLNRRYIVRRTAMIDYSSLQRNVPGGVTETDDPNADIKIEAPPDVTASSYQEQDRLNLDYDEVTGHFSSSSVGSNRQLNETVGGMNLLNSSADALTEYPLKIFVETWVKPVLKQLIKLEQRHETNRALLALMGEKLKLWQRFNVEGGLDENNMITDAWIQGSMNIEVNVGLGATNPQQRIEKLAMGLNTLLQFVPEMQGRLDGEEVGAEIFGALGYNGIERFFPEDKEAPQPQPDPGLELEKMKMDHEYIMHQEKMADGQASRQANLELAYLKQEEMLMKLANEKQISMEKLDTERQRLAVDRQNKVDEMKIKLRQGSGI